MTKLQYEKIKAFIENSKSLRLQYYAENTGEYLNFHVQENGEVVSYITTQGTVPSGNFCIACVYIGDLDSEPYRIGFAVPRDFILDEFKPREEIRKGLSEDNVTDKDKQDDLIRLAQKNQDQEWDYIGCVPGYNWGDLYTCRNKMVWASIETDESGRIEEDAQTDILNELECEWDWEEKNSKGILR